jgi:dTDP-4-amino-4,6-dideoxygalactose transaminase
LGAEPVFIDVSMKSLGMCPIALSQFLEDNAELNEDGICVYRDTGQCIKAIIPVHIFGHPVELDEILAVSKKWNIDLIEDAAESLGSFYKGKHTGTFGRFGAISFNGNKILTTGAGGIILSKNKEDGDHLKHITTTAKVPHKYEFIHDQLGFNYRLPNLNAALGCAQLESIDYFLKRKRKLALMYKDFFHDKDVTYFEEPKYAKSNYWLNSIFVEDKESRDAFLSITNDKGIMTRPAWRLMHKLKMFKHCKRDNLKNSEFIESHLVNLPSTPIILDQNDA